MKKKLFIILLLLVIFVIPLKMMADDVILDPQKPNYEGELTKGTPVLEKGDLVAIIFRLIQYLLAFLGVVAIMVILYGGYTWMTAAGNDEKVGKAKKILIAGVIGMVIILLAYAIAGFVIARLQDFSAVKQ